MIMFSIYNDDDNLYSTVSAHVLGERRTLWRTTPPGWMTRASMLMTSWRRSSRVRTLLMSATMRVRKL